MAFNGRDYYDHGYGHGYYDGYGNGFCDGYGHPPPVNVADGPRPSSYYVEPQPANYYGDDRYRTSLRRHHSLTDRHAHIPTEQVLLRREESEPSTSSGGLWWHNPDFPHGGHNGHFVFVQRGQPEREQSSSVEMWVPLCCDECERKVKKHMKRLQGVEAVTADQWQKKVVVTGRNLDPDFVLRRVCDDKPGSVFWSDRRS